MSSFQNSSSSSSAARLIPAALQDVVCGVDVVLGTSSMSVRSCLALARGSILELAEAAGDDLRIVVNGIPVAAGEVIIVDDGAAVRITEILEPPSNEVTEWT
ncbi:MAG: FliM/FliN family flagellar motor switch protein [Vicinamibacterales bacterium]